MRCFLAASLAAIAMCPSISLGVDSSVPTAITGPDHERNPEGVVTGIEVTRVDELIAIRLPDGAALAPVPAPPHPVVSGTSHGASAADQKLLAEKMAELDRLQAEVDQLRAATGTPQQIVVKVEMLEVSLTKMRQLGIEGLPGASGVVPASAIQPPAAAAAPGSRPGQSDFLEVSQGASVAEFIAMLKQNNIAKTLANPCLVTTSGRPASFCVGGEFPMPAAPGSKTAVEHREFGTRMDLRAMALGGNRVRLEIHPRISELDESRTIEIEGQRVPSLRVQEYQTSCEMAFGETLALGGLVQERVEARHDDGRVEEVLKEVATWVVVRAEVVTEARPREARGQVAPQDGGRK